MRRAGGKDWLQAAELEGHLNGWKQHTLNTVQLSEYWLKVWKYCLEKMDFDLRVLVYDVSFRGSLYCSKANQNEY